MVLQLAFSLFFLFFSVNSKTCPHNINIIEYQIDSPIRDEKSILWLTNSSGLDVILANTINGYLWRSLDAGRTWENVSLPESNEGVEKMFVSVDGKTVILRGSRSTWNSLDYGLHFHFCSAAPPGLTDLKFHPLHPDWVIGLVCDYDWFCSGKLYLSQDSGSHWAQLRSQTRAADWHGRSDDEKMIVSWEKKEFSNEWQLVSSKTFFRTDPIVLASGVVGYKSFGNKIFIATGSLGLTLSVSEDFGETFVAVRFPATLNEQRYSLLDTSEGSTFVNVQHDSTDDSWGNLYASNAFDNDFTLSLERNVRTPDGKCDFKSVGGLEGIYLANKFSTISGEMEIGVGKQTFITYDMGSRWQRLPVPQGIVCIASVDGDCNLTLAGTSDDGIWFSRKEAVGLILACGSASKFLINRDPEISLFVSRDAGWTWKFVANGKYTFEIGNRGAIILAMLNDKATALMKYSLNEGETWEDCDFTDNQIEVKDIISDPEMKSGFFVAYGSKNNAGVLISFDFRNTYPRECKGHDTPDTPDSDYESWQPSAVRSDECLLGRKTKYVRRKLSANCLNPRNLALNDFIVVKNCSCREENYECDFCFTLFEGKCVPDTNTPFCADYDYKAQPNPCVGNYLEPSGYRKVPGDTCDESTGINHMPKEKPCQHPPAPVVIIKVPEETTSSSSPSIGIFFLVIVCLISIIGGIWWLSSRNEKVRNILKIVVPEKFLPDTSLPTADYNTVASTIGDDLEEDAKEITIEDSTVNN